MQQQQQQQSTYEQMGENKVNQHAVPPLPSEQQQQQWRLSLNEEEIKQEANRLFNDMLQAR